MVLDREGRECVHIPVEINPQLEHMVAGTLLIDKMSLLLVGGDDKAGIAMPVSLLARQRSSRAYTHVAALACSRWRISHAQLFLTPCFWKHTIYLRSFWRVLATRIFTMPLRQ